MFQFPVSNLPRNSGWHQSHPGYRVPHERYKLYLPLPAGADYILIDLRWSENHEDIPHKFPYLNHP
jgi:hypothetical protein